MLIPASALVNGSTIRQEVFDTVTYWHVELDHHDILLAENMPAEGYLDMGNCGFFADNGVVTLRASPDADPAARTHADFCRPFHSEGALVEAVRGQLALRAASIGWRLEDQGLGDLQLMVDGVRLKPRARGLSARFLVPAGAKTVCSSPEASSPPRSTPDPPRRARRCKSRGPAPFSVTARVPLPVPVDVKVSDVTAPPVV